jgi:hypothetical protein
MSATLVPDAANETVAPEKVRDYRLASDHLDSAGKAYFLACSGPRQDDGASALAAHPANDVVVGCAPAGDGMRVWVLCNLKTPVCLAARHPAGRVQISLAFSKSTLDLVLISASVHISWFAIHLLISKWLSAKICRFVGKG